MSFKLDDYPIYCDSQDDVRKVNDANAFEEKVDISSLQSSWEQHLESDNSEQYYQHLLEQYPILVPGIDDEHHGPLGGIVVSKFPFGSDFVSDFAYATANSAYIRITFVEIEKPHKPIFTKDDVLSSDFNRSLLQVSDWMSWCDENHQSVVSTWRQVITECGYIAQFVVCGCILVFGRRYMIEKSPSTRRRWNAVVKQYENNDIQIMSYDRLGDRLEMYQRPCFLKRNLILCRYAQERFIAKSEFL